MRELTDTEKELVKALIENASPDSGRKLGDVLIKVYPIEYIEKNTKDNSFYNKTVKICHKQEDGLEAKLYESFSLIIMLIEQRYIVAKEFLKNTPIIGEKSSCLSPKTHYEIRTYYNFYEIDLWTLLDSQYYITNTLRDFVKNKFRAPEQKRFEKQKCLTWISILTAILIGILSPIISQCLQKKQDKEILKHIEHIDNTIIQIKSLETNNGINQ